jgi:hypothetical protein
MQAKPGSCTTGDVRFDPYYLGDGGGVLLGGFGLSVPWVFSLALGIYIFF